MRTESPSKIESVYRILVERISTGVLPVGECLPTEFELASELSCGRHTVSQAITRLVHEGLVERRRRVGTRVIRRIAALSKPSVELDAFAFIYPSDRHEGIWRTVNGFQEAARKNDRRVVTLTMGTDFNKEIELVSRLQEFDVKAAAIYPIIPTAQVQLQLSSLLVESKFPMVLVEMNLPGLGCPSVTVDGFHAGYTMTKHLLQSGVSRVGFLANFSWSPSVVERYQGYLWALGEAGQAVDSNLVLLDPEMRPNFEDPLRDPIALGHRYLELGAKAEGVVCSHDFIARGLVIAALERGMRVPKDLKVTGIDGFVTQSQEQIPLTTYHVPFEELGRKAFETLGALQSNKSMPELETRVRGEVVFGASA
ncbi:hypothetical protein BH09VER1_BH09VER1_39170 [soil metagenome]